MIGWLYEEDAAIRKTDRRTAREQSLIQELRLPLRELVREALFDTVIVSGLEYVGAVLEEERTELCGLRYRHDPERQALRGGAVTSSPTLGGSRSSDRGCAASTGTR
jgi:hypothetical protein